MSVSEKLGSHGSVKADENFVSQQKHEIAGDASGQQPLLQRTVIIQKDEKGYGLTVIGDCPVYVASVKPGGPAEKAGVQVGDRIIKVNGKFVHSSRHNEVVKLIITGPYVAFTLLGKPANSHTSHKELVTEPTAGLQESSVFRTFSGSVQDLITRPQPIDAEKEKEVLLQKENMYRHDMYRQMLEECETLKKKYNSSEKFNIQLQEKEKTLKVLEAYLIALPAQSMPSWPLKDIKAASVPYTVPDMSSDATCTYPSTSPTQLYQHLETASLASDLGIESASQNSIGLYQQRIIRMEDDDVSSEDENTGGHSKVFNSLNLMMIKPAHMAVFMNHVLHNHNPSSLLFYIIADIYSHTQGSIKDLKKWAYEVHSTFIIQMAPLKVQAIEEKIVQEIENNLGHMDKEEQLHGIFTSAQAAAKVDIEKLLENFREKKEKCLVFGSAEVRDEMEKSEELKLVERCLMSHLETSASGEEQIAQSWAIATFLRQNDFNKATHLNDLEHLPNFVAKDKCSSLFQFGSNKPKTKNFKGHQFKLHHLIKTEFCLHCNKVLWGIGYQGYQCQACEQCVHRNCVEELKDPCDKDKKYRRMSTLINFNKSRGGQATSVINDSEKEQIDNLVCPSQPIVTPRPLKDAEDKEINSLTDGHSVTNLVNRFDTKSPEGEQPRRKGTDLGRSESMKGRTDKVLQHDKPAKRSNSDLLLDSQSSSDLFDVSQGSSSNSGLSNRDGSVQSLDTLTTQIQDDSDFDVEPELPTLKQVLGDEMCKKLEPKEKKGQDVINELLYTEKNHVRALKILKKLFYGPMLKEHAIPQDFTKMLFPNLDTVITLHESLNNEMKKRQKEKSVITKIGDILLKRFDGDEGNKFRNGCATFCRNQSFALETLKIKTRKEPKLAQLLSDAENNPLCKRLALKDIIPKQFMRLTKYPLLIQSLLKYTQPNTEECTNLERALACSRQILEYVNQAVKDCENQQRFNDLQCRIDKKANDPENEELKTFDLTKHKLIHDGELIWNINNRKQIELHVVLLEQAMVLLQKLDDRLVLKLQNTQLMAGKTDTKKHSPLLWLKNVLVRNDATDKKAFFVMNTSQTEPQIYKLQAGSSEEQKTWTKFITQASEAIKRSENNNSKNNLEEKQVQPELTEISVWEAPLDEEQVLYGKPDTATTTVPVITPVEKLQQNDESPAVLKEYHQNLLPKILDVDPSILQYKVLAAVNSRDEKRDRLSKAQKFRQAGLRLLQIQNKQMESNKDKEEEEGDVDRLQPLLNTDTDISLMSENTEEIEDVHNIALPGLPIDPDIMIESVTLTDALPIESDIIKDTENHVYIGDISDTDAETEGEITEEESPEKLHENEPPDEDQIDDIENQSGDVDAQNCKGFDYKNYDQEDQGEDIDKVENDKVAGDGDGTDIVTEPNDSSFEVNIGDTLSCNNLIDQSKIIPDSVAIGTSTAIPEVNNVDNKLVENFPECIIDSAETTSDTIQQKNQINKVPDGDSTREIEKKVDILVETGASGNIDTFNNFLSEDIEVVETVQNDNNSYIKFNNNIENIVTENSDSLNEIYDNASVIAESPSTSLDIPTTNILACLNETMSSSEA